MHFTRNWPCAKVDEAAWPSTITSSMSIAVRWSCAQDVVSMLVKLIQSCERSSPK